MAKTMSREVGAVPKVPNAQNSITAGRDAISVLPRVLGLLFYPCYFSALYTRGPVRHSLRGRQEGEKKLMKCYISAATYFKYIHFLWGENDRVLNISGTAAFKKKTVVCACV